MDSQLVLIFLEATIFFGVLGWAVDTWLRSKIVFLYPAFGLVAFGAIAVPAIYVRGQFDLPTIYGVLVAILGMGVVGTWRYGLPHHPRILWRPQSILLGVLAAGLLALGLAQASIYLVPGGIDSAIHSTIIQGILSFEQPLTGSYPLGMHISIFSLERIFGARQELVFLSLYILVYASTLAGLAAVAARLTRWPIVGYAAVAVGIIDVSLYNNFLNGSGTHLFGAFGVVMLLLGAMSMEGKSWVARWLGLLVPLTFIWYSHYPTIFFSLITLWAWRLATTSKRSSAEGAAILGSLVLSIPLQFKLLQDDSYLPSISASLSVVAVVELILFFLGKKISHWLQHRLIVVVVAILSSWLFYTYADSYLFLPTWYGAMLVLLAFVGVAAVVFRPSRLGLTGLVSLAGTVSFYALLQVANLPGLKSVMVELGYYFGFSVSLMLLAITGIHDILRVFTHRTARSIYIAAATVYVLLIITSRTFDASFIDSLIPGDRPVSRYESSKGFGVFYTANDGRLAHWVKNNIPKDGIIANPGGLYNTWVALAEHEQLYAAYNVITIVDHGDVTANLTKLLKNQDDVDLDALLRRRVKYILLPEQFATSMYNSRLSLVKSFGQARFYEILPTVKESWISIPIGVSLTAEKITVATTGAYVCRYCGNTFYFTQQDILSEARLGPKDELSLILPTSLSAKEYELFVDRGGDEIQVRINGLAATTKTDESVARVRPGDNITLINHTKKNLHLRALGLRAMSGE